MVSYGDQHCTITIGGVDAYITGSFPYRVVNEVTSFFSPGYKYTAQYRNHQWDGKVRLFKKATRSFPAGLTEDVKEALERCQVRVTVDDQRKRPIGAPNALEASPALHGVKFEYPFDYQPECARALVAAQRGIAAVATNGGKTTIAALVTKMLRLPTLFLVPNLELLYQSHKVFKSRLKLTDKDVGLIGDGKWKPGRWITVASVDTLFSRAGEDTTRDFLARQDVVFIDECHHAASDSWYEVIRLCNAFYRFGMSGTPLKRSDGADMKLVGATGRVAYSVRNRDLIERGISVQPYVSFVRIDNPKIPDRTQWQEVYRMGIVENVWRNTALCKEVEKYVDKGLNVLVLVKEIKHGTILDKKLWSFKKGSFIPHQFINGGESTDVRQKALEDFRKGEMRVLIATSILDEGVDVPNIDVLVLAGGGKSSIRTLQRVGRGLRKGGNVDKLFVVDTADFQHPYLLKHSLQRMSDYKSEECFNMEVVRP